MSTYYKYQNPSEIGAAPTLDWGTVINNVNETLQKQEQQRFQNREADKKITNDILTKVNELNLTSDPTANALITNMAYEAKNNLLELSKKLKRGEISRSDFNILSQNTSSSIAQLNQFSKTYGADYDNYVKAVNEGKTSAYADFMQKWKGGFQNFKYKKLIHNPTDGRLYVAELDENGNVKGGDLGLVPMSMLTEVKNFNDTKVDVLAETNRYAAQFKPFVELVRRGGVETREQMENYPGFEDLVKNVTEAIAKNEKGYASILTDTDGTYKITGDQTSNDTDKSIGLKNNGAGEMIPVITDNMRARAREIVKEYIIAQTGVKETGMERFAPPRAAAGDKEEDKEVVPQGEITNLTVTPVDRKTGKKKGTPRFAGVSMSAGNIIKGKGSGIQHIIESVGYRDGKLIINGYELKGKEQEGGTGANKGDTTTEAKKTYFNKGQGFNHVQQGDMVESYIRLVTNPKTGEKFTSVSEALNLLRNEFKKRGGKDKQETQEKKVKGKTGKTIVVPN
jgi:hypothetical protein